MRHASQVNNLPLGTVLAPETDTMLSASDSVFVVEMDHADTEVLSSLLDLAVTFPNVGSEGLCVGVVRTLSETSRVGNAVG